MTTRLPDETFVEWTLRLLEEWEHERRTDNRETCVFCGQKFDDNEYHTCPRRVPDEHARLIAGDGWETDDERARR